MRNLLINVVKVAKKMRGKASMNGALIKNIGAKASYNGALIKTLVQRLHKMVRS